ncbi:helix-turn-helix domain-containing protein, partial [Burkholderia pseudomallei]|uniref:helix-turn-helix domain-containing protein n=1 Tax=Burkholderia pseudomallei TaxID=28450 RepID=UPI002351925E
AAYRASIDARPRVLLAGDYMGSPWTDGAAQTAMADTRAAASSYADAFAAWERQFLIDALAASNGKVTEAAARIGIGRATFYKKLATLGIDT